jgi:3-hydroxyacyl-[acyl-carrier-protein] dehydratase
METSWDINKILKILPQKYPFLFIDKVLEINDKEKKVTCLKNVTINDYFFAGHFPGNPIMPGALIIEALAQASIVLYAVLKPAIAEKHPDYYLGKVEAKFLKPVKVGDRLILEAHGEKILDKGGVVKSVAKVNGECVTEAYIVFGVKPK